MERNNHNDNKFFNGFLLGAIVGAGIVFLLGTKKGKRLLKAISEEGLENVSDLLKLPALDEEDEEIDERAKESDGETQEKVPASEERKPMVRRFFRGIGRRMKI